jgi:hypothetical protein
MAALGLVVLPIQVLAQPATDAGSNIQCVERLEIPEYPALPRQARIQGTQTVVVLLADGASIATVESKFRSISGRTNTYFTATAESAIRHSRFAQACAGKTVKVIFHYEFREGDAADSMFAFGSPNHFWIRAGPVLVMPESPQK